MRVSNTFGCDEHGKIWRDKNHQKWNKKIESVMICGSMAVAGIGNLEFIDDTMGEFGYLKVLQTFIQPFRI